MVLIVAGKTSRARLLRRRAARLLVGSLGALLLLAPASRAEGLPVVSGVSPSASPLSGGIPVTITGSGFTTATLVSFGGVTVPAGVVSDSVITANAPPGSAAGPVNVEVLNGDGWSATQPGDAFTYDTTPTVASVSPAAGPLDGGTVTITGTGFDLATSVTFVFGPQSRVSDPVLAANIQSDTQITVAAPATDAAATVDILVNGVGTSSPTSADRYSYDPPPSISSISPTAGPLAGGTAVTISGSGFIGATAVTFGGTNATSFTVSAAGTTITATTPAGAGAGSAAVAVQTPGGSTTASQAYWYASPPTVTSVSPNGGALGGGMAVAIGGTGFTGLTGVMFGSRPAASISLVSDTEIMATAPASSSAGAVPVVVTTSAGGTSAQTNADLFTYLASSSAKTASPGPRLTSGPQLTGIRPAGGPLRGGVKVRITGANLAGAEAIEFGSRPAQKFTVESAGVILAVAPRHAAGPVAITVRTPTGPAGAPAGLEYTYARAPRLVGMKADPVAPADTVITATIDSGGLPLTRCELQYGDTGARPATAKCTARSARAAGRVRIAVRLTRLAPLTTYRYRIVVRTAAGSAGSGKESFETHQFPLLEAPLVGLLLQGAPRAGSSIGSLLGIDGIHRGVDGESLTIRCVSSCPAQRLLAHRTLKGKLARARVRFAHPLVLSSSTLVEIQVAKAGTIGRYSIYAFAPTSTAISVRIVQTGCLGPAGKPLSCPAP